MDVPGHFVDGGRTSEEIPLEELIRPIVVVDIAERAARTPSTGGHRVDDLRRWERRHGRIPKGALVAMDSGWAAKAADADAFINDMHFPGFAGEATQWLIDNRKIGGIGVDTLSLDNGPSASFASHLAMLRPTTSGSRTWPTSTSCRRAAHGRDGPDPVEGGLGRPRPRAGDILSAMELIHTCYRIGDIDRSVEFYEALGFEERRRMPIRDEAINVFMGLPGDGDRLELTYNHGVDSYELGTGYNHIALTVDDLDGTLGELAGKGIDPEKPPYSVREGGSRICFVRDPDGYRIELIEKS